MLLRQAQQMFFPFLQMSLKGLEAGKTLCCFRDLNQHDLHITQIIQVIELILQETSRFLNAWMWIEGAHNIQRSQQAARRHTQIVDGFLRKFPATDLDLRTIIFPAFIQGGHEERAGLLGFSSG